MNANLKKGEMLPQTIENLQAIMERDAAMIEIQDKRITQLRVQVASLQTRLMKSNRRRP